MRLRQLDRIDHVDAETWNRCFSGSDPFVRFDFLAALERHGCVCPETGWTASHVLLEEDDGTVIGAAPAYLKSHSYGEFVFDFGWARAGHSLGLRYYPKLLCAVPFTPVCGPRLGATSARARLALARGMRQMAESMQLSSMHALFLEAVDLQALTSAGCAERNDVQFHWRNRGYADFDGFLADLNHDKRKKILRERRRIREAGLHHRWCSGDTLDEAEWAEVYALYANTYAERGQRPYLSLEFFLDYGRRPGTPLRLVSAFQGRRRVAVAITLRGGDTLYGRHWGAAEHYHSLHFETCYYQGVEYCITHGLAHFDAGAQGGHKLARGFEPEMTRSAHWLANPALNQAVRRALIEERRLLQAEGRFLVEHSPFRQTEQEAAAKAATQD